MSPKATLCLLLLAFVTQLFAAYEIDPDVRARNKATADRTFKENQDKFKNNPDVLVLPGLCANRKTKQVSVFGETTGLDANSPVEFFMIGETSGHGYESLAISFAMPSDVQKALTFIGMELGRPASTGKLMFWPKGERVLVTISSVDPDKSVPRTRIENLVWDQRSEKALPETGLVFTGSRMVESLEKPGVKAYPIDIAEPNSIASTYNAGETVLDVAFSWSQKAVYGSLVVNPAHVLKKGCLVEVTIEPEYKDNKKRVVDLGLDVRPPADSPPDDDSLEFHLTDSTGTELNKKPSLNAVLKVLSSFSDKGHDPYLTLRFSDRISIQAMSELCALFQEIDTDKGVRIEPPPKGQLYYRAFNPSKKLRKRAERITQPWELHLAPSNSTVCAVLTKVDQTWKENQLEPVLKVTDFPIKSPEDLPKALKEQGTGLPVIFVFSHPRLTYAQLMAYIAPVLDDYPMIHVYVEEN